MALIDVHSLVNGQFAPVEHPAINHFSMQPREGAWVEARVEAFLKGDAPFVSYVDPDDLLLPGSIDAVLPWLDRHKAISTNSVRVEASGAGRLWRNYWQEWSIDHHVSHPRCIHQLVVVERGVMERAIAEFTSFPGEFRRVGQELLYAAIAKVNGWVFVPDITYVWFNHGHGVGVSVDRETRKRISDFIREYLR